jgi:nitrite reductase (NO-forming)
MNLVPYQIVRILFLLIAIVSVIATILLIKKMRAKSKKWRALHLIETEAIVLLITLFIGLFAGVAYSGFPSLPMFVKTVGPGAGPQLPLSSAFKFLMNMNNFDRVKDIAADPNKIPAPITRKTPDIVNLTLTASEVLAEIKDGTTFNYWTFDNQVPGPFIRARVGDTIQVKLINKKGNLHEHSVDFHAVNGPGGGASVLKAMPGQEAVFVFKALNPGIYIYHCASPPSPAMHMAHGQYGLILIEPEEGLPKVDREFYVVQGEIYTTGNIGDKGLQAFDAMAMLDGNPNYVVFNGRVGGLTGKMEAKVGDTVRIYVGNGGVNLISSFHIIGEIFDTVYPEGSIGGAMFHNVQSTIIPAGGAAIVEFKVEEPGNYVLVDHALARVDKGAFGILKSIGIHNGEIYYPNPAKI